MQNIYKIQAFIAITLLRNKYSAQILTDISKKGALDLV